MRRRALYTENSPQKMSVGSGIHREGNKPFIFLNLIHNLEKVYQKKLFRIFSFSDLFDTFFVHDNLPWSVGDMHVCVLYFFFG